jgi:hypothetical protein
MAHELTHRWAARLRWNGADPMALLDRSCHCHWNPLLATPAVYPVSHLFSDTPYPEESVMGGMRVQKSSDGASLEGRTAPWGAATGLSALDLYVMGLIGPEEVPETLLIMGASTGENGARGGVDVPVRIADIIAANGPQNPPARSAQRRFRLGIYLLFEDGREPHPEKIEQARGIESALIRYFSAATNGRMEVTTGQPTPGR